MAMLIGKPKASRSWQISGSNGYVLDVIINYDIKYRMGNAPESEARREGSSEAKNGEAAHKGPHELNAEE